MSEFAAKIPHYTKDIIDHYVAHGSHPGDFVKAVLSNDLKTAVAHADDANRNALADIVCYLYNDVPSTCWGSPQAFEGWIEMMRVVREEEF